MNTLTKLALGMMGRLQPKAAQGDALSNIVLPPADTSLDLILWRTNQQILLTQTIGQPKPAGT